MGALEAMANMKQTKNWKLADKFFSLFIRTRDKVCQFCLSAPSTDTSHYHKRDKWTVRYDELNSVGACRQCHCYYESHQAEYEAWMIKRLGLDRFEKLFRLANVTLKALFKSKREVVEEAIKKYKGAGK